MNDLEKTMDKDNVQGTQPRTPLTGEFVLHVDAPVSITLHGKTGELDINATSTVLGQVEAIKVVIRFTNEGAGGLIGAIQKAIAMGSVTVTDAAPKIIQ